MKIVLTTSSQSKPQLEGVLHHPLTSSIIGAGLLIANAWYPLEDGIYDSGSGGRLVAAFAAVLFLCQIERLLKLTRKTCLHLLSSDASI